MKVEFKMQNPESIEARLRSVTKDAKNKGIRSALGSAAKLVRLAAVSNAQKVDDPETGRKISNNIKQRWRGKYYKRTGDMMVSVGVETPNGRIPKGNKDEGASGPTPHWHLIEEGTENARAQPFMRPALQQNAESATNEFAKVLDKRLTAAVKRLAKQG